MKRKISGNELRDRMLSGLTVEDESTPTEKDRIEALSSPGNRELLEIISTKRPQSIGELSILAQRLQPNVSRSLSALGQAGLLTITREGRASVPTLTIEGQKKANELGFMDQAASVALQPESAPSAGGRIFSAEILEPDSSVINTDDVQANVAVRFLVGENKPPLDVYASLDLTEVCTNLAANWWRALYRRGSPYRLFPIERRDQQDISRAMLLVEAIGRIELFVRPFDENPNGWEFPRRSLTIDDFSESVLNAFVRPLVGRLRAAKRFNRPVESHLRRLEEISANSADLAFWKCAGALGLTYRTMNDEGAGDVEILIRALGDEDARLEFASAVARGQLKQSLEWISRELSKKDEINRLPRLTELRRSLANGKSTSMEPWNVGYQVARKARERIGLSPDRQVNGLPGLTRLFGGSDVFSLSAASDETIRGYLGHPNGKPVVIVRNEGPVSSTFLASRAIGDYLVFGSREAPIANIYSDRQAVGRAFAAEFLAPARGIVHMMDEEQISLDAVAKHYGVPATVVRHQYENNIARYVRAA